MRFRFWRRFRKYFQRPLNLTELRALAHRIQDQIPREAPFPDWGKASFLRQLPDGCRILDVGCGNNSPFETKAIKPDCYYVGIDVADYNQATPNLADEYIIVASENFAAAVADAPKTFDAVISSHNLEHCDDRDAVIRAMAAALKPGGKAYISFPSADSVNFPSRAGSLNYYDDGEHRGAPPDFSELVTLLNQNGVRIAYASTRYQPPVRWLIGLSNEAQSARSQRIEGETWPFWGFETVVWAEKR